MLLELNGRPTDKYRCKICNTMLIDDFSNENSMANMYTNAVKYKKCPIHGVNHNCDVDGNILFKLNND